MFVKPLDLHSSPKQGSFPSPGTIPEHAHRYKLTIVLMDCPHEPAVHFPAGDGNVGLGWDASKKGGSHLANSLEVKWGQQWPSPAVFAPGDMRSKKA